MQPQALDLPFLNADQFNAAEGGAMSASEIRQPRCFSGGIATRLVMRIEDIDLDLGAFTTERQNIRVHRLRLTLSVRHAQRPVFPWNISEPARECLAFHLVAKD